MAFPQTGRATTILTTLLTGAIAFAGYLLTLAPTVTFEDSGELITAAVHLGVPHQPGYPLYTLIGHLFSHLPGEPVAWRLNLMSAAMSAGGAAFLCAALLTLVGERRPWPAHGIALATGLLAAWAFEPWEQAVITEVYGLNMLLTGAFWWTAIRWGMRRDAATVDRLWLLGAYIAGLAASNHTTALMMVPIAIGFALVHRPRYLRNPMAWVSGVAAFFAGLLPYLYLPLASRRDPWMDWGNPETWTGFWRTVTRQQYGIDQASTLAGFRDQMAVFGELFWSQWAGWGSAVVLFLAIAGLWNLWRKRRSLVALLVTGAFFAGPFTTWMTNFDVSNPAIAPEHTALVSVFYIPFYLITALTAGIGMWTLVEWSGGRAYLKPLLSAAMLLLAGAVAAANGPGVTMRDHRYAEHYAETLFRVMDADAVVFANWDPFYFPLNYYQYVEGRRPDVLAIDQQLLKRSWYLQWMRDHYPDFMASVGEAVDEFLKVVAPFEAGLPHDGNVIQRHYEGMINAMIDSAAAEGRPVYFTYEPPPGIAANYGRESVLAAIRLRQDPTDLLDLPIDSLDWSPYRHGPLPTERMALVFHGYYGRLILVRAQMADVAGRNAEAWQMYGLARDFFRNDSRLSARIDARLAQLAEAAPADSLPATP